MVEHGDLLHIDGEAGARLRAARLDDAEADVVAVRLKALSDPTRLNLALALRGDGDGGRELCVCDLSWVVQRSQNLVSHHMKILKGADLVTARREGKMTMYTLTPTGRTLAATAAATVEDRS